MKDEKDKIKACDDLDGGSDEKGRGNLELRKRKHLELEFIHE